MRVGGKCAISVGGQTLEAKPAVLPVASDPPPEEDRTVLRANMVMEHGAELGLPESGRRWSFATVSQGGTIRHFNFVPARSRFALQPGEDSIGVCDLEGPTDAETRDFVRGLIAAMGGEL